MSEQSILMAHPDGSLEPVDASQAAGYAQLGYAPATADQISSYVRAQQAGSPGQTAIAGLEGFGRSLSFGLSTGAERALGVDPADIRARQEANPAAVGAGEALGVAAPLFLTDGLSVLADGAELTAPALIARAGGATTRAADAALPAATSVAGRIARAAVTAGAGGAIEGAAYGLGNVVNEAMLGDPGLTGQRIMGEVGISALLGGGFSGALGIGGESLSMATSKAREAIGGLFAKAPDALGAAFKAGEKVTGVQGDTAQIILEHRLQLFGPDGLEHAAPGAAQEIATASPATAKFILDNAADIAAKEKSFPGLTKALSNMGPDTGRFILDNWQGIFRDEAVRARLAAQHATATQAMYDATESALRVANREIRPEETRLMIEAMADPAGVSNQWRSIIQKFDDAIEETRQNPELYPSKYGARLTQVRDALMTDGLNVESEVPKEAMEATKVTPTDAFRAINEAKQNLDDLAKFNAAIAPDHADGIALAKRLRGTLKDALHDQDVWGYAAARQQAFNDAQSEYLTAKKLLEKRFMTDVPTKAGRLAKEVDPTKVDQWFTKAATPVGAQRSRVFDRYVAAARDLVEQIHESEGMAPTANFDRLALRRLISGASDISQDARTRAAATRLLRMQNPAIPFGAGIAVPFAKEAAQATSRHIPGVNAVVSTVKAIANVPRSVAALTALERMSTASQRRIESLAASVVAGGAKVSKVLRNTAEDAFASREDMESSFAQRSKRIIDATSSAPRMATYLDRATGALHEHAPSIATAVHVGTGQAAQFLASKLPIRPSFALGSEWKPSPSDMARWSRYYDAVEDPASILKQAAAGTLSQEAIEAVKTVYPQLFQQIQATIAEKMAGHREDIPYRSRLMLSMLLGGDLDGSTTQPNLLALQASYARPPQQPRPANPAKLTLGSRSQTATDSISTRER